MNLETQVCALEYSKRLAELEVSQESVHYWNVCHDCEKEYPNVKWELSVYGKMHGENISTFTASELAELLPPQCSFGKYTGGRSGLMQMGYKSTYYDNDLNSFSCFDETLANAMAKLLIKLIEDGLHAIK